jgi:hypothetical protein
MKAPVLFQEELARIMNRGMGNIYRRAASGQCLAMPGNEDRIG